MDTFGYARTWVGRGMCGYNIYYQMTYIDIKLKRYQINGYIQEVVL
jgi:hypothetical protein